jgi:hypothetical protein
MGNLGLLEVCGNEFEGGVLTSERGYLATIAGLPQFNPQFAIRNPQSR